MTDRELINAAVAAMQRAYAPYSGFTVGAAVQTESGQIFDGCNIENASYSATICAERTALAKAVSAGERKVGKIAIVGGRNGKITDFCPPCGVCRQFMAEFCGADTVIILFNGSELKKLQFDALLPNAFGRENVCES